MTVDHPNCEDMQTLGASWRFDFSANPKVCEGVENISMLWGRGVPQSVGGNSQWLLGANEPNSPYQSNISPQDYAPIWRTIQSRFPDKKLTSAGAYDGEWYGENRLLSGVQWLRQWRASCEDCRVDALAAHCYFTTASQCISTLQDYIALANEWGVPEVWLTEVAFWPARSDVNTETTALLRWMRQQPKITRWAWFTTRIDGSESWVNPPGWNSPLIDANGLTHIGTNYRSN